MSVQAGGGVPSNYFSQMFAQVRRAAAQLVHVLLYALMIVSHRVLRYATPFLHLVLLGTSVALDSLAFGRLKSSIQRAGLRCESRTRTRGTPLLWWAL